jgi:actin related protein 2/3 complex subunit 1A/1B
MDWHPDGNVLAVGTLAGKVHLLTTFLGADVEMKAGNRPEWADQQALATFNSEVMSINVGSWVHALAFSPSGNALAWANHEAVITILYPATGTQSSLRPINKDGLSLPFKSLLFLSETVLMAVGYEPSPVILSGNEREGSWQVKAALTNDQLVSASKLSPTGGAMASKRSIFETASNQGRSAEDMQAKRHTDAESSLGHLNTVRAIDRYTDGKVATMGLDGRLIFWSVAKVAAQYGLEGIRI